MGFLLDQGIKAIWLDIDGTLYPKRMLNWRMAKSVFPSLRLGLIFNSVRKEFRVRQELVATNPPNREGLLARQAGLALEMMRKPVDSENLRVMVRKIDSQFYKKWGKSFLSIKPFPGLNETLSAARAQGIFIGVFSDFPIERKLEVLSVEDYVQVAISSEDSGYLKPSDKAFAYLLSQGTFKPEEILYVGDSYDKDVLGAKKAGMYACLLSSSKGSFPKADLVVRSWGEFASLVL
jgi:putative hydrolase of the HAD superfamily